MKPKRSSVLFPVLITLLVIAAAIFAFIQLNRHSSALDITVVSSSAEDERLFAVSKFRMPSNVERSDYPYYLLSELFSDSFGNGYFPAAHASFRLLSVTDGVAHLDLSAVYATLPRSDMALSDYCMVNTLCSLPEIDSVVLSVNRIPHPLYGNRELSADSFKTSFSDSFPHTVQAGLYFPDIVTGDLSYVNKRMEVYSSFDNYMLYYTLTALFSDLPPERSAFPSGTSFVSGYTSGSTAYVTLSDNICYAYTDKLITILLLRSIVCTLTELPQITSVQLFISGDGDITDINGIDITTHFTRDTDYGARIIAE